MAMLAWVMHKGRSVRHFWGQPMQHKKITRHRREFASKLISLHNWPWSIRSAGFGVAMLSSESPRNWARFSDESRDLDAHQTWIWHPKLWWKSLPRHDQSNTLPLTESAPVWSGRKEHIELSVTSIPVILHSRLQKQAHQMVTAFSLLVASANYVLLEDMIRLDIGFCWIIDRCWLFRSVLLGLMQPELPDVPNGPFCGVDVCSQSIETLLDYFPALFIAGIHSWSSPPVSRYHVTKSNSAPRRPHIGFLCFTPSSDAMCATSPIADWARSSSSIDTSIMETLVQQSAALTSTGWTTKWNGRRNSLS